MAAEQRNGSSGFAPDFRVGDWLVEPSLDRLSRNGSILRIRPQLTNLLVLLARHAGRTVSKDEIIASVWDGQFVAESGMTRCVAELRHALEDDAREPRLIETIPKRGYRLVAPVVFLQDGSDGEAAAAQDLAEGGSSGLAGRTAPAVAPTAAVAGPADEEPEAPAPIVPADLPADEREAGRAIRTMRWGLGFALSGAVLLAVSWAAGGWSRAPVLTGQDSVVLADVVNTTGDAAFDGTLRLALAVQLGQAPFLHILSGERVRRSLVLMGKPHEQPLVGAVALEVCRREGAAVLLAGSIARLGSHYALGLEAMACRTGESIDRQLLEVESKDGVLKALGTAAARIRQTLGESRASLRQYDVPIVQATTPSLEALKALSLGDLNRDHSRLQESLTFYRRATELDPQFALAWARRSAAARNLGESAPDERFGGLSEPLFAIRRAYDLRERVSEPERFYILAHYYRFAEGDLQKSLDIYRIWKRTYPGSLVPTTNLASLYNTFGQFDAALAEAREAVKLAPYGSISMTALVAACLGANRPAEARQALRDAANRGIDDLLWHELSFQMDFMDGDERAMQEHTRWASGDPQASIAITGLRAAAAAAAGRLRESRRLWSEAAATAEQLGPSSRQAGVREIEAVTEALLGDPRASRAAAEAALAVDDEPVTLLSAAIVFALCGDAARAQRLIDQAAHRARTGLDEEYVWRPVAAALAQSASGEHQRALETLGEAAPFERGREFGLAPLAVRASIQLSAGRAKEAAGTYQGLLGLRALDPLSPWAAYARLGLARALRDAGDVEGSRAAYAALVQGMKDGDRDAPLLAAARREAAALPPPAAADAATPGGGGAKGSPR